MGYYIKPLPYKKSSPNWKVQFISYKKTDTKKSKAKKPKREWDIAKNRWSSLGFNCFMDISDAKARAKQLNAQLHLKKQEQRLKEIEEQDAKTRKKFDAVLPEEFVVEFENRFIRSKDSLTIPNRRKNSRAKVRWKATQKMISSVGVEPSEWFYNVDKIYDYFYHQKYSVNYMRSVLSLANLWGFFICRKLARPFLQVPMARGYERLRIIEANFEKKNRVSRASKQLSPEQLNSARLNLNKMNFNWLFISVWFGLRPKEIDCLKNKKHWKTEILPNGRLILWVFQTKIIALPLEDRWKPIPLIFDEQRFALKIIEQGNFKRPLQKTIRKHLGDGYTSYAGRKGFSDLMLSRGQLLENISIWMGHSSIDRTWRSYKNKQRFHLVGY